MPANTLATIGAGSPIQLAEPWQQICFTFDLQVKNVFFLNLGSYFDFYDCGSAQKTRNLSFWSCNV
jgi:hypothetical protein